MSNPRLFLGVFVSLLVATGFAFTAHAADPLPDPEKPGPYPVGVTTMLFVDHSRTDEATKGPRSLMTEIWYPATDDSKDLPKNRLLDFYLGGKNLGLLMVINDDIRGSVIICGSR